MLLDETSIRAAEADVQRWVALWPVDGPGPIDLDDAIGIALEASRHIEAVANRLPDAIEASAGKVVYDLQSARAIQDMDTGWLMPIPRALGRIADVERGGGTVRRAAAFREAVLEARMGTSVPVERVARETEDFFRRYPDAVSSPKGLGHAV